MGVGIKCKCIGPLKVGFVHVILYICIIANIGDFLRKKKKDGGEQYNNKSTERSNTIFKDEIIRSGNKLFGES